MRVADFVTKIIGEDDVPVVADAAGVPTSESSAWIAADQALSTVTNFALLCVVARSSTSADFGKFALIQSVYSVALAAVICLSIDPLIVRFAGSRKLCDHEGSSLSLTVISCAALGVVAIAIGIPLLLLDPELAEATIVVGLLLPGLGLHEGCRQILASTHRARQAFWWDTSWTIIEGGGLAYVLITITQPPLWIFFSVWGGAGAISGIASAIMMRCRLGFRSGIAEFKTAYDIGIPFFADYMASSGVGQLVLFLFAGIGGLIAAGALRALQALFGPLNMIYGGFRLYLLPRVAQSDRSRGRVLRLCIEVSGSLFLLTIAFGLTLAVLPEHLIGSLFGSTWVLARPNVLLYLAFPLGGALAAGPIIGTRGLAMAREGLSVQIVLGMVTVASVALGLWMHGLRGGLEALLLSSVVTAVAWWRLLLSAWANKGKRRMRTG